MKHYTLNAVTVRVSPDCAACVVSEGAAPAEIPPVPCAWREEWDYYSHPVHGRVTVSCDCYTDKSLTWSQVERHVIAAISAWLYTE